MTIFYPDLSNWNAGYVIPAGTPAVVAKATEGLYYQDASYHNFKAQAQALNVPFSGYHFLKQESSPEAQAAYYHGYAGNTPCMVDVEEEGGSRPGVDWTKRFITALEGLGGHVWSVYYPRWYLALTGGSLAVLGVPVISSDYESYSDNGNGWLGYGDITPIVWQYTSSPVDRNAFKGTAAELASLINGENMTPEEHNMLANLYGAMFSGGSSMGYLPPGQATNSLVAHITYMTQLLEKLVGQAPTGAVDPNAVASDVLADLKAKL